MNNLSRQNYAQTLKILPFLLILKSNFAKKKNKNFKYVRINFIFGSSDKLLLNFRRQFIKMFNKNFQFHQSVNLRMTNQTIL